MASNLRFGLERFALKSSWSGFPQLWLVLLLGPRQVILATALYPLNSSHLKCYIIELSNLGLCWPKLTIMSSLHYKSTSRLHYIFMFTSIKLSKPKGPFQNIALGWSILCLAKMTQLRRCHLNQGALPASHICPLLLHWWWLVRFPNPLASEAGNLTRWSPAPKMPSPGLGWQQLFPCYAISLSVFDALNQNRFCTQFEMWS